jgi:hypothetical protein
MSEVNTELSTIRAIKKQKKRLKLFLAQSDTYNNTDIGQT